MFTIIPRAGKQRCYAACQMLHPHNAEGQNIATINETNPRSILRWCNIATRLSTNIRAVPTLASAISTAQKRFIKMCTRANADAMAIDVPRAALAALENKPNVEFIEEDAKRYPFVLPPSTGTPSSRWLAVTRLSGLETKSTLRRLFSLAHVARCAPLAVFLCWRRGNVGWALAPTRHGTVDEPNIKPHGFNR